MKQIRVKSPFLDITASNQRREVGDILLVTEERAAYLVSGKLCEYVNDDEGKHKDKNPEPQTPATTEPTEPSQPTEPTEPAEHTEPVSDGENGESGNEADKDNGEGEGGKDEGKVENSAEPAEKAETPSGEGKKESKPKTTKGGKK